MARYLPPRQGPTAERPLTLAIDDLMVYTAVDTGQTWCWQNGEWHLVGARAERVTFIAPAEPVAWKNMPAVRTEFLGGSSSHGGADCRGLLVARLSVNIAAAGAIGAFLTVEFSPDGLSWADLAPGIEVSLAAPGHVVGPLVPIAPAARLLPVALFRLVGEGGDGAADPEFGRIALALR